MIPVDRITEQELEKRMNGLSPRLQDALNSGSVLLVVDQICRNHHLVDEERVFMVRQIVAVALFGFIHSYDISREINESLALNNPKLADSIAQELEAKIFTPLKGDLEAVYEPLAQKAAAAQAAPMPISEIGKSDLPIIELEAKPVPPSAKPAGEVAKSAPGTAAAPLPVKIPPLATQEKAPVPLTPTPATKPPAVTPITERMPAMTLPRPISEILPQREKVPAPLGKEVTAASPQPPKPAEPAPFFIHKETQLEPVKPGSDFRLEFLTPKFKDVKAGAGTPPSGAAELVIGGMSGEKKPGVKQTEIAPPRVVHYSQWKTPLKPSAPAPEKKNDGPAPVMLSHAGGAPLRDISSAARSQPAASPPARAAGTVPPPPPAKLIETRPPTPQALAPRPPQPAPPHPSIPPPPAIKKDEAQSQPPKEAIAPPPRPVSSPPTPQPPIPPTPRPASPPTPPKPPSPQPPLPPTPPSPTPPPVPPSAQKPDRGGEVIDLGAL